MLTIGIVGKDNWAQWVGNFTEQLMRSKISQDCNIQYYDTEQAAIQALLEGEIFICTRHLSELSTRLPTGIVIAALSERQISSSSLVFRKQSADESQLLSLKNQAIVSLPNEVSRLQFLEMRPDVMVEVNEATPLQNFQKLHEGLIDACLLPTIVLSSLDVQTDLTTISLSPKEFVPEAGQGILAFLTAAEDVQTRRQLKEMHTPSVSAVSNVERRLKQLSNDAHMAAYCEKDRANNYHVWVATLTDAGLKKTRLSQSTHFKMAEQCYQKLINE